MVLHCDTDRLARLLERVHASSYSNFYQQRITTSATQSNLEELPLLTRADIVSVPPEARCFVPPEELVFTAYSSGTSSNTPLLLYFAQVANYHFDPSFGGRIQRPLIFYPPLLKSFNASFVQQCTQSKYSVLPVFGDLHNITVSAALITKFNCDAVYATPTLALRLAEQASTYQIRTLVVASEIATETTLRDLAERYPRATIINLYASAEVGQFIMGPTADMVNQNQSGFVPNQEALVAAELLDNELVLTYDLNPAFPLIRYRTGDHFILAETSDFDTPVLQLTGREGVDRVRVAGFEVTVGVLDEVFNQTGLLPHEYQLHIASEAEGITFTFEVLKTALEQSAYPETLNSFMLQAFKLAQAYPLQRALQEDIVGAVAVKPVAQLSVRGDKRRPLISHL
jgi:phenylacetate-coenzyme A ligase PaaK-like adenylate-forming protein